MKEEKELEEYLEDFINGLNKNYPCFIEYLNHINELSFYVNYLGENIIDSDFIERKYLKKDLSKLESFNICLKICQTLGYENEFINVLDNKILKFKKATKKSFSYTKVKNNKLFMVIEIDNTVEDVIKIMHEFFHYLHISKYEDKLKSDKCYLFSETFAAIGELYAILYLYNNNIYKDDIVTYFKAYFNTLHVKANYTLINGIMLDIYNKHHSLDSETIDKYILEEEHDDWVKNIVEYNFELGNFDFFENAGYAIALIPALLVVISMQENNDNILNVKDCIENIHDYNTMEKLYKKLNVYEFIYNQDNLVDLVSNLYHFFKGVIDNNEIEYQKKIGNYIN